MVFIELEEADEDGVVDNYGAASNEEDGSGLGKAVVITYATKVGTKEEEEF